MDYRHYDDGFLDLPAFVPRIDAKPGLHCRELAFSIVQERAHRFYAYRTVIGLRDPEDGLVTSSLSFVLSTLDD